MKTNVKRTKVKPIPDGFHSLTPYLIVQGAAEAIEFYKKAFGAKERFRIPGPNGKKVGHAEIVIGDSILMLADEFPGMGKSPKTLGDTAGSLLLYVKDVDAAFKKAVTAGATVKQPVEDKFYGERAGCLLDPFGHVWTLMTHIEDLTGKEIMKRAVACAEKMGGKQPG